MSRLSSYNCLDFETANEQPSSVCSVGVVIVRNDIIVDSFYSLIHPEPEYYQWFAKEFTASRQRIPKMHRYSLKFGRRLPL